MSDFVLPYCRPTGMILTHHIIVMTLSVLAMWRLNDLGIYDAFFVATLELGSMCYNFDTVWGLIWVYAIGMKVSSELHIFGCILAVYKFGIENLRITNWIVMIVTLILTYFRAKAMIIAVYAYYNKANVKKD